MNKVSNRLSKSSGICITKVLVLVPVVSFLQLACWVISGSYPVAWVSTDKKLRKNPFPLTFKSISSRSPRNPHSKSCDSSFLRWPWQGYFPFVRDFSKSSMLWWRMGLGAGNHSICTLLFFCTVSFEAKENAGFTHYLLFKWGYLRQAVSKSGT